MHSCNTLSIIIGRVSTTPVMCNYFQTVWNTEVRNRSETACMIQIWKDTHRCRTPPPDRLPSGRDAS